MDGDYQLSVPFELLDVDVFDDGRIWAEWKTLADDGGLLIESAVYRPEEGESVDDCLQRCLTQVQELREEINKTPPKERARKAITERPGRVSGAEKRRLTRKFTGDTTGLDRPEELYL